MRLFIFARHAESAFNAVGRLGSDPSQPIGLTRLGTEQARELGQQIANLDIDLAVTTRSVRTRETIEVALKGRDVPLLVEPDSIRYGPGSLTANQSATTGRGRTGTGAASGFRTERVSTTRPAATPVPCGACSGGRRPSR